jgi:hypothetical protein
MDLVDQVLVVAHQAVGDFNTLHKTSTSRPITSLHNTWGI